MEVRAAGAMQVRSTPRPPDAPAQVPANPAEGLKPQEVPLLLSQSPLAQGQSLAEVPLIEAESFETYTPQAILPDEVKKVLDAYNGHVRQALEHAQKGSELAQFETSVKLMANLQDPHLQQDKQAWDVLQMRHSPIERAYQRLIQEPEVKQAFETARYQALNDIFGARLTQRAHQQAAYLLNDSFQRELDKLPEAQVQPRIEQELSALAILDPKLAKNVANELITRTAAHQSLKALQAGDDGGAALRANVSQALGLYLKAQQTAVGLSLQATNISRVVNLSDKQIGELTDAIADLARDSKASTPQQLALNLASRVEELPPELRQNASSLIRHMQAQNVLGTILLAGSVAGLLRQDMPKDPKAWLSLGAGTLGTATAAHVALRTLGLNKAADIANKLNFTTSLRGVNIPVIGAMLTGVNTTLDAMAFVDEVHNEDTAGAISHAMGVGSGLTTLAAITLMKGKAAPIALIGSTLTGLAAWGIDSLWGESDATGKIRQDLRAIGISADEKAALEKFKAHPELDKMSVSERVDTINALMDKATSSREEKQIVGILMHTPDKDFLPLMQQLHTPRLMSEIQGRQDLRLVLQRVAQQAAVPGRENDKIFAPMLQGLVNAGRFHEMNYLLEQAPKSFKQTLPPAAMQAMVDSLLKGWTRHDEEQAVVKLLSDKDLDNASQAMLKLGGEKLVLRLNSELDPADTGALLGKIMASKDADLRGLAAKLFSRQPGQRLPYLSPLGPDAESAKLAVTALGALSPKQIQALPAPLKASLTRLLTQTQQGDWLLPGLKTE